MTKINNSTKNIQSPKCPICGEEMKADVYAYDNNVYGKVYFKCPCCGHKYAKIN